MSAFGDQLKETREARGLSLDQVAETTRIARHHLAALERSDVEALPPGPFAKGYIEAYARLLDVDPGPILEAYRAAGEKRGLGTPEAESRMLDELSHLVNQRSGTAGDSGRPPSMGKWLAIALGAAGLLAIGGWLVTRGGPADDPVATSPRAPAPAFSGGSDKPAAPPPTAESPRRNDTGMRQETASPREADHGTAPPLVPKATPEPAAPVANPNIEIPDSGVGTGVENRRLVGRGDRFPEGSEVVFWTRVYGGEPGNVIQHLWLHEGRGIARIPLTIGGSHWRTYSRRPLPRGAAGRWVVEARGLDGSVLARQEFLCVPRER